MESDISPRERLSILMVTGVYQPEVSGAANQCRQLVNALKKLVNFTVLTTTRDSNLLRQDQVDGIDVFRVLLKKSVNNYCKAVWMFFSFFLFRKKDFQIVHLHGFSLKSFFLSLLSRIFNKKVIIKMTSVGHDDPISMKRRGFLLNYFFSKADAYVGMSPQFEGLYRTSKLPSNRLKKIPNGVETNTFHPIIAGEKGMLRDQMGLPRTMKLILFVGHFSREKCPDILLDAWKRYVAEAFSDTGIIFVGSTNPDHYEVNANLVENIKELAEPYFNKRIFFIESTQRVEKYYQAADIFVLPSLREGMPNALLEAMSCGLPAIVSRLEGVTDWVVSDKIDGLLVEPGNGDDLGKAIKRILSDYALAKSLGREARRTVIERFSMNRVAGEYAKLYEELVRSA